MKKTPIYGTSFHYSDQAGADYLAWQDALGEINGELDSRKFKKFDFTNSTLLDFGCGTGNLLKNLRAKESIAVEVNLHAHSKLKQNNFEVHETIETVPANYVDFVISHHSLEHVPFPIAALIQMRRVLKTSGQLILVVPIDDYRNGKKFDPTDINHHLNTWNPQLIGNTLIEAGFEVKPDDIKILNHAWFPFYDRFYKYPFFDLLCKTWSIIRRRRQIIVIVSK